MEEVYVVKVKTRPERSKLYPSERRYSAVTVGGLGLVHALLAGTALLLAALGVAAEGVAAAYGAALALGAAAAAAAAVGVLAWRRWYVDNNIRYFLATSLVSGSAAVICIVLTVVAIATMQEELTMRRLTHHQRSLLPLAVGHPRYPDDAYDDLDYEELQANDTELIHKFIQEFENRKNRSEHRNGNLNETGHLLNLGEDGPTEDDDTKLVSSVYLGQGDRDLEGHEIQREESPLQINDKEQGHNVPQVVGEDSYPYLHYEDGRFYRESASKEVHNVLLINILVASFLELAWSLLSVRIAWKGTTNDYPDDDGNSRVVVGSESNKPATEASYLPKFMQSVKIKNGVNGKTVRGPDIISNHHSQTRGVPRKMQVSVVSDQVDQYLPQEESTTEYQERVRRFLASNSDMG